MRLLSICTITAALGLAASGQAGAAAHLLTFERGAEAAPSEAGQVRVLRGPALGRQAPEPAAATGTRQWQVLAGDDLWLADLARGELVTCRLFRTTQVGERVVRCFEGDLPRGLARD